MTESYDNTRPPGTLPPSYPAGSGSYETATYGTTTYTGAHVADDDSSSKVDQAKEKAGEVKEQVKGEAQNVAHTAASAGSRVAGAAKEQAANVTGEARRQAKDMLQQTRTQLTSQASGGQQKVAGAVRALSTELSTMASASDQPGVASDLVHQASSIVDGVASWIESREPSDVLSELTTYARRRPGTFLLVAAGAGLLAGRLARGLKDEATQDQAGDTEGYATGGYSAGTAGYSTDTGYTSDAYVAPTTSAYGTTTYGTPDVPGATTGGYGGTA